MFEHKRLHLNSYKQHEPKLSKSKVTQQIAVTTAVHYVIQMVNYELKDQSHHKKSAKRAEGFWLKDTAGPTVKALRKQQADKAFIAHRVLGVICMAAPPLPPGAPSSTADSGEDQPNVIRTPNGYSWYEWTINPDNEMEIIEAERDTRIRESANTEEENAVT